MKHLRVLTYVSEIARHGSIRRAAERLNLTPSALTRQIQDLEYELGTPIFERFAKGMRLNAAGELLVRHIRDQVSDLERVRSQIADLSGVRRGHVKLACSQAFVNHVVPDEVEAYRAPFPLVTFTVLVRDHLQAIASLAQFESDLALVLQPPPSADLQVLFSCSQPLYALMRAGHPLSRDEGPVRLRECLMHPMALPDRSLAIRHHLDDALARKGAPLRPAIESSSLEFLRNLVLREDAVSLQVPSGIPDDPRLCRRPIDARDLEPMSLILGQLRGRTLPVATAKFADRFANSLNHRYGPPAGA
ncbi:LysR family transcriptional regulator [Methylobacterium sp. Leaf399]|uniref:LysR family transcriptional regulator n=1 Tax=unclassified Methylobacterium TaxID=2615210 RepID=UPI0006FD86E9|nr:MULTISPECIES: LysR family transcriptional regulator [unclassified Methylobacterium]KQP59682.1 LysR family transcriptional regulator [Methylobacterium sp. Leaf108]KQT19787.1 LysR family transcriptional regulator [Methylobacterium sp. Leaf399]KQT83758.1 LysR family transcriptional regulator [Methylobacterium sp. Leaf466]